MAAQGRPWLQYPDRDGSAGREDRPPGDFGESQELKSPEAVDCHRADTWLLNWDGSKGPSDRLHLLDEVRKTLIVSGSNFGDRRFH